MLPAIDHASDPSISGKRGLSHSRHITNKAFELKDKRAETVLLSCPEGMPAQNMAVGLCLGGNWTDAIWSFILKLFSLLTAGPRVLQSHLQVRVKDVNETLPVTKEEAKFDESLGIKVQKRPNEVQGKNCGEFILHGWSWQEILWLQDTCYFNREHGSGEDLPHFQVWALPMQGKFSLFFHIFDDRRTETEITQ